MCGLYRNTWVPMALVKTAINAVAKDFLRDSIAGVAQRVSPSAVVVTTRMRCGGREVERGGKRGWIAANPLVNKTFLNDIRIPSKSGSGEEWSGVHRGIGGREVRVE